MLRAVITEVDRLEKEANHSSPSSARFTNEWSYNSPPLYLVSASTITFNIGFSVLYDNERLVLAGLISLVIPVDVFVT
jgi:hypothetical protein